MATIFKARMLELQERNGGTLKCDFCGQPYTVDRRDDDWLNACEPCGAEGAAQLEADDARFGKYADENPYNAAEKYRYSSDRDEDWRSYPIYR